MKPQIPDYDYSKNRNKLDSDNEISDEEGRAAILKLFAVIAGVCALFFFYQGHTTEFELSQNRLVSVKSQISRPPKYHEETSGRSTIRWIEFKISALKDSLIFDEKHFEAINIDGLLNEISPGDSVTIKALTDHRSYLIKDATTLYDTEILGFAKGEKEYFEYKKFTANEEYQYYTFFFISAWLFLAAGVLGLYNNPVIFEKEIPATYILIIGAIAILYFRA